MAAAGAALRSGGIVGFAGFLILLQALVAWLAGVLDSTALAALVVGGAALLVGVGLVLLARSRLKAETLVPRRTVESLRQDAQLAAGQRSGRRRRLHPKRSKEPVMSENLHQDSNATTGTTGERSPEELEREIAGTRASIDSTVGELAHRLSPRQLADDAREYVRETATRGASNVWTRVRETTRGNAMPIVLIGSGIAWYILSAADEYGYGQERDGGFRGETGYPGEGYGQLDEGREGARRYAGQHERSGTERVTGMVSGLVSRTGQAARTATQRVSEQTSRLGDRAQGGLERAREGLGHVRREQPLLLGLAGVALGALVGGAFPTTRRENEMLGDVRDRALDKVAEVGRQTAEQIRQGGAESQQGHSGNGGEAPQS